MNSTAAFVDPYTIFNIKGNDYRLETIVAYRTSVVVIEWIGTHTEYDARSRRR